MKNLILKAWAWVLVAFGIICFVVFVAYEQHRAADKYERDRQSWCATLPATAPAKEKSCADKGPKRDSYLPWWYVLVTWPEGMTTWAIVATGFVIAWQSWETRKAAKAARDAIILEYRPKVVVRSLRLVQKPAGGFDIKLVIRNSGVTTAHIEDWSFDIMWIKDENIMQRHTEYINAANLMGGEPRILSFTAPEFYRAFDTSRLLLEENYHLEQGVSLGCVALIPYKDEIGTARETAISRLYMFRKGEFEIPSNGREADYSD